MACESQPILLQFSVDYLLDPSYNDGITSYDLNGNILDLAIYGSKVFVSRDNIHAPRTFDVPRHTSVDGAPEPTVSSNPRRICVLEYRTESKNFVECSSDGILNVVLDDIEQNIDVNTDGSSIGDLIYGLSNLRKRAGEHNV